MEVVHDEEHRSLLAHVGGQPVETVKHRERPVLQGLAHPLTGQLEHGSRRSGRPRQQARASALVDEQRFEQLADDPEREVSLQLAAARGEHTQAALIGERLRRGQQPGLADPRRPLDEDDARTPVRQRPDRGRERLELPLALEQASARPGARSAPPCPHPSILGLRRALENGANPRGWRARCLGSLRGTPSM
jgi:hypothetical protein